jgi:hypothetical protein
MRFQHALQREIGRLAAPFWVPLLVGAMRFVFGYRIERIREVRAEYRRLRETSPGPLLLCANHLTMIDSLLISWALVPTWETALHFDRLTWNTPDRERFASTPRDRVLSYLAKCIPIVRGGTREETAAVLTRVIHLLSRGEVALIFPEGGRSRTGRVEEDSGAWGVGRIVGAVPGCRVLCVYMRGRGQATWSSIPARGERFELSLACIEPKSDARGVRRSRDFARQIVSQLRTMEARYFEQHRDLGVVEPGA